MVPQRITRNGVDVSRRTVLVVDDDAAMRALLTDWLGALGYRAEEAGDADTALEMMRKRQVNIALCDICMPGHDGVWLVDQLRRHFPDTAIVIATGLSQMDPSVTLGPGVAAYIVKPFEYDTFATAIEQALALPRPGPASQRQFLLPAPSEGGW